ncbi:MAG TPA: LytR C-terminal domain-containing protein [Ilumatobacter sp.]|nr:LytR C-terminal domain-containing protein [Ilumatobacter sp.]
MSDVPDGSGPVPRRTRVGDGGAPVSGALAMVLAAIALVAGFFILRSISDGGEQSLDVPAPGSTAEPGGGDGTGDPDATGSTAAPQETTTTTEPPLVLTGASVMVANANGIGGSAGGMARTLEAAGFTLVDPTDASSTVGTLEASVVYYEPAMAGAQAVAESVNRVLGGDLQVSPLQGTPPTQDGSMDGAGVLLMLGTDKANKTLDELNPTQPATEVTNPPVAGETTVPPG